jgi:hypothetical protein
MGEECGIHGGEGKSIQGALKERDHTEDVRVDGRMRLKLIFKKYDESALAGLKWLAIKTTGGVL